MNICVYGASSDSIDRIYIDKTEELGRIMARRGIGLVFGAGAQGLMGACARGAYEEKGNIIGIVPRFFSGDGIRFDKCTEIIYTDTMRERKKIMEEKSEAFIAAPGGIGTFDEFFEIFTLQNLGRHRKPVAVYNINGYYDGIISVLKKAVDGGFMKQKTIDRLIVSDDPADIIDKILKFKYE
jgi:uncharacterized protein (TIGR00730 family)